MIFLLSYYNTGTQIKSYITKTAKNNCPATKHAAYAKIIFSVGW